MAAPDVNKADITLPGAGRCGAARRGGSRSPPEKTRSSRRWMRPEITFCS